MLKNKCLVLLTVVMCVFTIQNVIVVLRSQKLSDLSVNLIHACGESFPEIPDMGGGFRVRVKYSLNYYTYTYSFFFQQNGVNYYNTSKIPTTQVVCDGNGEVNCVPMTDYGLPEYVGVLSEQQLRELGAFDANF